MFDLQLKKEMGLIEEQIQKTATNTLKSPQINLNGHFGSFGMPAVVSTN